jgi:hypothetical protein
MVEFGGRCMRHRELMTPELNIVAAEGSTAKAFNGIELKEIFSQNVASSSGELWHPSALRDFRLRALQKRKIKNLLGSDLARHASESFAALNHDAL